MARRPGDRIGFTLVEALLGVSLVSICGTAVLLGLASAVDTADQSTQRLVATGLAEQYLDEILGKRYCETPNSPFDTLGPGSDETSGVGRSLYDDVDDYAALSNAPPVDPWNVRLGIENDASGQRDPNFQLAASVYQNLRVTSEVYYVSSSDMSTRLTSGSSRYRAVHVRVYVDESGGTRQIVNLRRVVGYVPSL